MRFAPAGSEKEKLGLALYELVRNTQVAVLAGGCFWGVEDALSRLPGVVDVRSGYTGGHTDRPSYEDVCRGDTGHAEAVLVRFDPKKISYEAIVRRFFEIHDPTQLDRQGPDVGSQYRSAIFWLDESQKRMAQKLMDELRGLGYDVVTRLEKAGPSTRPRPIIRILPAVRAGAAAIWPCPVSIAALTAARAREMSAYP